MVVPDIEKMPLKRVAIDLLTPSDSPRLQGLNISHVHALAEMWSALPPIIVHHRTCRVIDGMHRVQAAMLRGETEVEARLYDGDERGAFALAVRANVEHGLPLSLADRNAAAARIIALYPEWSDRAIASCSGLAPKTVAAVRRRSSQPQPDRVVRRGLDGRNRPLSTAGGRLTASRLMHERPNASLREIAKIAGIAPSTVLDVRNRLASGENPVPECTHDLDKKRATLPVAKVPARLRSVETRPAPSPESIQAGLRIVRTDPSMRFNAAGRLLLRWLSAYPPGPAEWEQMVNSVPSHCVDLIVDLAHRSGDLLYEFARQVQQRQVPKEELRTRAQ